ncbi:MAG: hypothetical protein WBG50_05320 [Desulfomonilaceae bacterium]
MGFSRLDGYDMPSLSVEFYDIEHMESLGQSIERESTKLSIIPEDEIPLCGKTIPTSNGGIAVLSNPYLNRDYYRDMAKYVQTKLLTTSIDFVIKNNGRVLATDVRVECEIDKSQSIQLVYDVHNMPTEPRKSAIDELIPLRFPSHDNHNIKVKETQACWKIQASLGKIQPQSISATSSGLYLGARESTELKLKIRLFADNLPVPHEQELLIRARIIERTITVEEFMETLQK